MPTLPSKGDIARNHPVDDLGLFDDFAVRDDFQTWPFNDKGVLVPFDQFANANLRDECCVGILLGIFGVAPVFVLDENNPPRTDEIRQVNKPDIGLMSRNPVFRRFYGQTVVWRHPLNHRDYTLLKMGSGGI